MNMKIFTTKDKKVLFKKLAEYLGKFVTKLKEEDGITYSDICKELDEHNARITNLRKKGILSEPLFRAFIRSGMTSIDKINDDVKLDEKEKNFLDGYRILENKAIQKTLIELRKSGVDENKINDVLKSLLK